MSEQFNDLDFILERNQSLIECLGMKFSFRGVLHDDCVWTGGAQQFKPSGSERVGETSLPFEQNHIRLFVHIGLIDRIFNFACQIVAHHGVSNDTIFHSLQPRSLPGTDQKGIESDMAQALAKINGSGALSNQRIGAEHGEFKGFDLLDLAAEKVQLRTRRWAADVADLYVVLAREGLEFGVFGKKLV